MKRIRLGTSPARALAAAAAVALLAATGPATAATAYFVRAAGDDTAAGTTRATAWRSLERVNAVDLGLEWRADRAQRGVGQWVEHA